MTEKTIKPQRRIGRPPTVNNPLQMDLHIGQRIRMRRTLLGISQESFGEQIGLSFQQVQKYERGQNRVAASRLHQIAGVLDVPISFFFDDFVDASQEGRHLQSGPHPDTVPRPPVPLGVTTDPETLRVIADYVRLPAGLQLRVREFLREAAKMTPKAPAATPDPPGGST